MTHTFQSDHEPLCKSQKITVTIFLLDLYDLLKNLGILLNRSSRWVIILKSITRIRVKADQMNRDMIHRMSHSFRVARKSRNWRIRIAESFMRSSGKEKKSRENFWKRNENQILESILKIEAFKRAVRDPLTTPSAVPLDLMIFTIVVILCGRVEFGFIYEIHS